MLKMKKAIAAMLIMCLAISGISVPSSVKAATSTELKFVDGGYSNEKQIYVVNVAMPDGSVLDTINTVNGTVLVNGVETAVKFEGYGSPTYYQILIPYSAINFSVNTTHGTKQGTHYITVPAGTTVGNITVSKDFHVKLYGGTMTSNDSLIEQVTEVPDYYFASWNYGGDKVYIQFRNTIGTVAEGWTASPQDVYVDGKAVSVRWEGDGAHYYFPLTYGQLSATGFSDMSTHIIRIPGNTTVGKMSLAEDVWIKINSSVREELVAAEVSLDEESGYHDGNAQYVIRLKPEDGKTIITPGASSTKVLIDGVEVDGAISAWDQGDDNYGACIKYNVIEDGATTAADIGSHTITFPAGTYVGNRILTKDYSVAINGQSVSVKEEEPKTVGLELVEAGYQDGNNGNYRYVFWLKPDDGRAIVAIGSATKTIYVDGNPVSKGVSWVDRSDSSGYALAVNYSAIQSNASVSTDVGRHIITIPAGTVVGDLTLTEDFMIKVDGRSISAYKPVTVSVVDKGYQDGNNGNYRYIIWIAPDDGRPVVDLGSPTNKVLIDGEEVTSGISWTKGGASYGLCIKYDAIVPGATHHNQIGEHVIVLPKGSSVGDVELLEDLYIKVNNGDITTNLTTIDLAHSSTDAQTSQYQIWFKVSGAMEDLADVQNATVYIDGEKVTGVTYTALNDTTGRSFGLNLPYSTVESGATSWETVTKPHILRIPKNSIFNGMILKDDIECAIIGGTVTQILEPDVTVTAGTHANNATCDENGFYFTVTPEDALAYNADGSVKYHFIKNGITVDGSGKYDAEVTKLEAGVYYIDLSAYDVQRDDIVSFVGIIQEDDYVVEYTETYFQYKGSAGWVLYIPPTNTDLDLENDYRNGGENRTGIYITSTGDPLAIGNYYATDFIWDEEGDEDEIPERHGGVHLNDVEVTGSIVLQKQSNSSYYLDLSGIISDVTPGDIVRLEGTLFVDNNYVAFHEISFKRNADGSFSRYDANVPTIPAETIALGNLYINVDEQASYTIPSTPHVTNSGVTVKVNGKATTNYTLNKEGIYQVQRIMENTVLAETISTVGDTTYDQTIYMFETGDANLSTEVSAADIVNLKKNAGNTEGAIGGASDLNYNDQIDNTDYVMLVDLILDKKTPAEIIAGDEGSVVIGAISDLHYLASDRDAQNRISTRKALNYYKSLNADIIFFNGDISDLGEVKSYQKLVADITSVYPETATRPKMVFTGDNHEWYDAWDGINGHVKQCEYEDTQARFVEQLSSLRENNTDTNTHYEVNGYHFIGVSSDGMNGGYATYKDTTISWLETQLEKAAADATGSKPIFLGLHQAPYDTVNTSNKDDHFDSEAMETLLKKYPQLVVITSHTHAPLQDEKSIHQRDYTTLNTASLYYVGGESGKTNVGTGQMSTIYQYGQGLVIRADGSAVDVERRDFYNDKKIKDNWTFTAGDNMKYTAARANNRVAPTFPSGSTVQAAWISDTSATLTFNAATHSDYVQYYIVKVYRGTSTTPSTYNYSNFYFLGLDKLSDTVTITVDKMDATKDCRFEIQAVESWGKTSTPISGSLGAR